MQTAALSLLMILCLVPGLRAGPVAIAGAWVCTVDSRSDTPQDNFGIEVKMLLDDDGLLLAEGQRILPGGVRRADAFKGLGHWTLLEPETGGPGLIEFGVTTPTLGRVTWYAAPVADAQMYHFAKGESAEGQAVLVETQCGRTD